VVSSADVLKPSATEPVVPLPVNGLVVVIPVMVPPPEPEMGNVWLGLKLMTPLDAMERPVAVGPVPEPKRSASLAVGDAVSLPDTSVCQA